MFISRKGESEDTDTEDTEEMNTGDEDNDNMQLWAMQHQGVPTTNSWEQASRDASLMSSCFYF